LRKRYLVTEVLIMWEVSMGGSHDTIVIHFAFTLLVINQFPSSALIKYGSTLPNFHYSISQQVNNDWESCCTFELGDGVYASRLYNKHKNNS
jgi:hypothetical protein